MLCDALASRSVASCPIALLCPIARQREARTGARAMIAGDQSRPTNGSVLVIGDTVSPDTAAQHFQAPRLAALDMICHENPVTQVSLWKRLSTKIFGEFLAWVSTRIFASLPFRLPPKFRLTLYQNFEMALSKFAGSRRAVVAMAMIVWNALDSRKGIDMTNLSREELERTATHFCATGDEYITSRTIADALLAFRDRKVWLDRQAGFATEVDLIAVDCYLPHEWTATRISYWADDIVEFLFEYLVDKFHDDEDLCGEDGLNFSDKENAELKEHARQMVSKFAEYAPPQTLKHIGVIHLSMDEATKIIEPMNQVSL